MNQQFRQAVFAVWAGIFISICTPAPGQDPQAPTNYLIYPVTTELQRELAPSGVNVMVFIDATDVLWNDKFNLEPLNLKELSKALQPYKKPDTKLNYTLFSRKMTKQEAVREQILRYALIGIAHECGVPKVSAVCTTPVPDKSWTDYKNGFTSPPRQPVSDEAVSKNELVKVYPVYTELSRCLTSDADCAVIVTPSLVDAKGKIPEDIRVAITELVEKQKLKHKVKVSFHLAHIFNDSKQLLLNDLYKFAETLGFETSTVSFR